MSSSPGRAWIKPSSSSDSCADYRARQGRWGTGIASAIRLPAFNVPAMLRRGLALQHALQRLQPVGVARRLVPAQPADARKAHRDTGFVPRRSLQALEGDFQHQALLRLVHDVANRTELLGGIAADEAVDLQQLLVGEAEIGLADRNELIARVAGRPYTERVVRVVGRALAVAALRIHQHRVDDMR